MSTVPPLPAVPPMPTLPPALPAPPVPRAECAWCASALLTGRRRLRALARRLARLVAEPESWLDVGTGDGAFPDAAREFFPYTSFDGVDPGPRVLEARAAERVEEAYVGPLAATGLTARYDVVSLLHHLEHSADPRRELTAALTALRPGGHLVLELHARNSPFRPADVHRDLQDRDCTLLTARPRPWAPAHRVVARKN
ncbi:class I SAM-dependent methyltransferase [Streptomyces sp. NPDC014801]|uniref:class I SAM-dependent methyltransferase n=1 Tax=Streptomyces sp. NPDC014801 TaxID=3364916 RepID=UPI0036FC8732